MSVFGKDIEHLVNIEVIEKEKQHTGCWMLWMLEAQNWKEGKWHGPVRVVTAKISRMRKYRVETDGRVVNEVGVAVGWRSE